MEETPEEQYNRLIDNRNDGPPEQLKQVQAGLVAIDRPGTKEWYLYRLNGINKMCNLMTSGRLVRADRLELNEKVQVYLKELIEHYETIRLHEYLETPIDDDLPF